MGITFSPYDTHGFSGVKLFMLAKTFDHPRARASAASAEFLLVVVVVVSSLIIASLTALRSKRDQSLSSRYSWADLPPLGREVLWSFSMMWKSLGACHDSISEVIYLNEFSNMRVACLDYLCHSWHRCGR